MSQMPIQKTHIVDDDMGFLVVPPGIEPGTQGFSVLCSSSASESSLTLTFGSNQLSYCTL